MGNSHHKGPGTPDGGQFASASDSGIMVRDQPLENDIASYMDNKVVGNRDPLWRRTREENIGKALYDGGYTGKKKMESFENADDAEAFLKKISTEHKTTEEWRDHKDLVENYTKVVKGYAVNGKFDLVVDGDYTAGGKRTATELMSEFGWGKKEVADIILNHLDADSFVSSGANDSRDSCNNGTVVMVFAPRIRAKKGDHIETVDLYVKTVLNAHPNKARKQTEMQILSVREAGGKTCLFTGERRDRR